MTIDLKKAYSRVVAELGKRRSITASMHDLIDFCAAEAPHPDWQQLRSLPYADIRQLVQWIELPFRKSLPAKALRGLWFGLFNPVRHGIATSDLYVCGSERFYAVAGDNGWAVRPEWWPEDRYASSTILDAIYQIAASGSRRKSSLGMAAEYPLSLGYAALAVRDVLSLTDPKLLLGSSRSLGIAVGFDSGDFILLGNLTLEGLKPLELLSSPPELPVDEFLMGLRSPDMNKFIRAILDLSRLGGRATEVLPDLLALADDEDPVKRQFVLNAIVGIAPSDSSCKDAILRAFDDPVESVRRMALEAVISVENLSPEDLDRIRSMEDDPEPEVASWSEIALRNIRLRENGTEPD